MHEIQIDQDILQANLRIASTNRKKLDKNRVTAINLMGAIGSGKTSLAEKAIKELGRKYRFAAIAGDVVASIDENRYQQLGIPVIPLNTGKECHLDAHLVSQALEKLPLSEIDILLIENVGNLICPADYNLGEHKRVIIVSVSEGDDIIEKHPLIFTTADLVIINKIDIAGAVGASPEKMEKDAATINPKARIIKTSLVTGEGIKDWLEFLEDPV